MIRVLLADDQALVRGALAAMLGLESDILVVAQVGSRRRGGGRRDHDHADVALLDVQMPGGDGLDAAAALHDALPVVPDRSSSRRSAARATFAGRCAPGASGFVVKDAPPEQLVDAVRRVHAGLRVVDPVLAAESPLDGGEPPHRARARRPARRRPTGPRWRRSRPGCTSREGTVRNHLSAAIGKTTARTRAEAVRLADERGWL